MDERNRSVGWVAMALAVAVAYFGWVFLAADYWQADPAATERETNVWVNSIAQLPHVANVVRHGLENRLWVIALIGGLELGVLALWVVMRKLERELWSK